MSRRDLSPDDFDGLAHTAHQRELARQRLGKECDRLTDEPSISPAVLVVIALAVVAVTFSPDLHHLVSIWGNFK